MYFGNFQYRRQNNRQAGYMLLVLFFIMTALVIGALYMAPAIARQIQRDREEEMIHRGVQYARAIQKYYKKFGRYPPSIEALEDTNHIRFLRKRYQDPMTPDGKWQIVRFGQVQFNAAARQGGGGFSGQTGLPNVPGVTGLLTGQNPQSPAQQPGNPATGSTSSSGGRGDTVGGGSASSFGQSTMGGGNQLFGGGAIIGVASVSDKQTIRVFDDKNHYKDWKFVYDPTFDRGGLITGPYDPKKAMGQFVNNPQPGQQIGKPIGQPSGGSNNSGLGSNQLQPYQPPDQPAPSPKPQ